MKGIPKKDKVCDTCGTELGNVYGRLGTNMYRVDPPLFHCSQCKKFVKIKLVDCMP